MMGTRSADGTFPSLHYLIITLKDALRYIHSNHQSLRMVLLHQYSCFVKDTTKKWQLDTIAVWLPANTGLLLVSLLVAHSLPSPWPPQLRPVRRNKQLLARTTWRHVRGSITCYTGCLYISGILNVSSCLMTRHSPVRFKSGVTNCPRPYEQEEFSLPAQRDPSTAGLCTE
jgi:hypothetical protein